MKKTMKILSILLVVLMIITACGTVSAGQGAKTEEKGTGTMLEGVNIAPKKDAGKSVEGIGNSILGIIQVVGTIIAVGVLMVIGIKYMMGQKNNVTILNRCNNSICSSKHCSSSNQCIKNIYNTC